MRVARGVLGIDQRALAELSGLSLPTIRRMEASDGVVRGNVGSLMKLVADGAASAHGGRGVRLTTPAAAPRRAHPQRSTRRA